MRTRLNFTFHAMIAGAILCLLASCGKTDITPDCGAQFCQIQSFEGDNYWWEGHVVNNLTYNKAGNPVLRTRSDVATGNENESYRYDAKQRLTDQILHYSDGSYGSDFREWHRFKYHNNQDRPYMDSLYNNGTIGDNPIPYPFLEPLLIVIYFNYDAKGRLIEENSFFEDGSGWYKKKYLYNSANNLEKLAASWGSTGWVVDTTYYGPYDNKINFLQTNKVWQLLTRNYSENNTQTAVTYNKYGLPLQFPNDPKGKAVSFLDADLTGMKIVYKCK
ncbi:hypothetical protein SAMN05428949_2908 [Chitinophaga sp. YR627]|uniref:hypothetical protein n=1 Tax=Chitinophaga sp. YR627 TaxID=1881041 RepID=UPI0008EECF9B|nr:hypothetical protein [Chitinophaga sp. YR627]SFN46110.1 hypothetical protein SAMN05428949_2908 [Chitinophaga sp. YR627]